MPGVLMIEALTQVAAVLRARSRGVAAHAPASRCAASTTPSSAARSCPATGCGSRSRSAAMRSRLAKAQATAYVDEHVVAEAELLLVVEPGAAFIDPSATCIPAPQIGAGTIVGPNCVDRPGGPHRRHCRIGASVVIDGWTEIGDDTQIFPMASIGLAPQDLKYRGEHTRLTIGQRNIFREFVTINRGTPAAAARRRSATTTCSWPTCTWRTTATSATTPSSGRTPRSAATSTSRTSPTSAPARPSTSSAASAATASSAATRSSPRTRCRSAGPSAAARRASSASTRSACRGAASPRTRSRSSRQAYRYLLQSKLNTTRALAADRAGSGAVGARGALPGRLHPHLAARRHPAAADRRRRSSRMNSVVRFDVPVPPSRSQFMCHEREHGTRNSVLLGLIAGNGRFPFLVLDAARAQGHDVTIIALKEETFPELNDAASAARRGHPLDLARPARHLHQAAQGGRRARAR